VRFEVIVQPSAEADAGEAARWLAERSPFHAEEWLRGLERFIETLAVFPKRGTVAPESGVFDEEIREIFYGQGHGTYRVLYTVQENLVHILHVRHGARRPLRRRTG
jgi:plasmid stabilization system protein ParE